MAFQAGDLEEPAGLLHAFPLVDFPQMAVSFQYEWLLPNGRNASDHHLFPVPVPVSSALYTGMSDTVKLWGYRA